MKGLKLSRSTWLSNVQGISYPGPEFMELAKIIFLEVYTWIYGYTNTHMSAHLHSWIVCAHLQVFKAPVFRVFIFHSFSLFLHRPSLPVWLDSWEIPAPWEVTFQNFGKKKISNNQIYDKL